MLGAEPQVWARMLAGRETIADLDAADLTGAAIARARAEGRHVTVRFRTAVAPEAAVRLVAGLAEEDPGAVTAVFQPPEGGTDPLDLGVLRRMPALAHLGLLAEGPLSDAPALGALAAPRALRLAARRLPADILCRLRAPALEWLCLGGLARPKLDLSPLARFEGLRYLSLGPQGLNPEAIASLPALEELYLTGKAGVDYGFLSRLPRLAKLSLGFGRCAGFSGIASPTLARLLVARVAGLDDLGDLARFPALEQLMVQSQGAVERLRFGAPMARLRHIRIDSCKTFTGIDGYGFLNHLDSLRIRRCPISPDSFPFDALPRGLGHLRLLGRSHGTDAAWDARLRALGYDLADIFPIRAPGEPNRADPMPIRDYAGL